MVQEILLAFGTLLAIVNPVSTAFVFNAIAHRHRPQIARTACITAVIVLVSFLFLGQYLLEFFGITIYAFRVAGGIYLAKIGFEMLAPKLRKGPEQFAGDNIGVIPIAIPLLSGPGSMASVLVMADIYSSFSIITAILLVGFVSWIVLLNAHHLERVLGRTGTSIVERILGLIVLVISVQFVFNGITGYLEIIGFIAPV